MERLHITVEGQPLDDADSDVGSVVDVLDGIPGTYERAQLGLRHAETGDTVPLDEL